MSRVTFFIFMVNITFDIIFGNVVTIISVIHSISVVIFIDEVPVRFRVSESDTGGYVSIYNNFIIFIISQFGTITNGLN